MECVNHEDRYCVLLLTARIALSFGRLCDKTDPNRSDGTTMAERALLLGLGVFVECKISANSRIHEIYGTPTAKQMSSSLICSNFIELFLVARYNIWGNTHTSYTAVRAHSSTHQHNREK